MCFQRIFSSNESGMIAFIREDIGHTCLLIYELGICLDNGFPMNIRSHHKKNANKQVFPKHQHP